MEKGNFRFSAKKSKNMLQTLFFSTFLSTFVAHLRKPRLIGSQKGRVQRMQYAGGTIVEPPASLLNSSISFLRHGSSRPIRFWIGMSADNPCSRTIENSVIVFLKLKNEKSRCGVSIPLGLLQRGAGGVA